MITKHNVSVVIELELSAACLPYGFIKSPLRGSSSN